MQVRLLGGIDVADGEQVIAVGGPKERRLLAVLAIHANAVVSEDRIFDVLWGDRLPRTATKTLQGYVSRLRKSLSGGEGFEIEARAPGYVLRVPAGGTDVDTVQDLVARAEQSAATDPKAAGPLFTRALSLWRGAALEEFAEEPFAVAEAGRLSELRQAILEERIETDLRCGRHSQVLSELEALTTANPLREPLWGQRMLALYRAGRQADALRVFQELRSTLRDELGLEPSPDLRALENAILQQSPDLTWQGAAPQPSGSAAETQPARTVFTVVFTDIVGSTELLARFGDARYRAVLDAHDGLVRDELRRHGGREVKTVGDGFVAVFDAPGTAIACVQAIMAGAPKLGIQLRAGLHAGECIVRGDDIGGIAVHVAARIAGRSRPDEILVSATVKDLIAGSEIKLVDRGSHALKGVPRRWSLFAVDQGSSAPAKRQPRRAARAARPVAERQPRVSVLLVDDHPLWRDSIRTVLEHKADVRVIAEASSGTESVALAKKHRPDVVVMDVDLPGLDGIDATRRVLAEHPAAKVLMLSSSTERDKVVAAVRAGAMGYLVKTAGAMEIAAAIGRIHAGELVFPPELARVVMAELRDPGAATNRRGRSALASLTDREREVLGLMAQGRSNQAIADRLALSAKTVEAHSATIFTKLGLEATTDDHRRVLAVLAYLDRETEGSP